MFRDKDADSQKSFDAAESIKSYGMSIFRLMKSIPFVLLVVSYGLNVGCFYAISALINQLIKPTFLLSADGEGLRKFL